MRFWGFCFKDVLLVYIAYPLQFATIDFSVDTGRKLNVHKRFRRRPGRLLNVLYTFNVRPVSTGLLFISKITVFEIEIEL